MRKLISSINISLDGYMDHIGMIADEELHRNVNQMFAASDTLLFGRKTYQLMEDAWPAIVKNPTGNKPMDEFAVLIDNMQKVVFSRTLKSVGWKNARLATGGLEEEVSGLKKQPGKNIMAGGASLIIELMNLDLIDEYHFCIHPIIFGSGQPMFKNIRERVDLKLIKTSTFGSGAINVYYERTKR